MSGIMEINSCHLQNFCYNVNTLQKKKCPIWAFYFFIKMWRFIMAGTYRKRGNSYQFEYMHKGQRYTKSVLCSEFNNIKEVKEYLDEFTLAIRKRKYATSRYSFYDFTFIWLKDIYKSKVSPITFKRTLGIINKRLLPFFRHLPAN